MTSSADIFRKKYCIKSTKFPCICTVKINPSRPLTKITGVLLDNTIKIDISAIPENGKANKCLQHFFKKNFGIRLRILSGKTSARKKVCLEKIEE